ncbi:MAG: D-alanyl-D-alanine carboxypeptidase, partial [Chitinispirillia bacterium]
MNKLLPFFLICFYCISISADNRETIKQEIRKLIHNGSLVLNDEKSKTLISINSETLFVPASIIKILTSYIAIDLLGINYKFQTEFFKDQDHNLAIKGWGDPYLISEEIDTIAVRLKNLGIKQINKLYLDNSVFAPFIAIPGVSKTLNPYDALNSALVVNFNTINIRKDEQGRIYSGETETPLTPLSISKGSAVKRGSTERINLSYSKDECLQYVGELVTVIFNKHGIVINNSRYIFAPVNDKWNLVYVHKNSKSIATVLEGLLKYSNNFIANQIFLTVGAEKSGTPATIEKSKEIFTHYVNTRLNIPLSKFVI